MRSIKVILLVAISATFCICAAADAQPAPRELGFEGISSARPALHEGGPGTWTVRQMHQAQRAPLPKFDPDAVRAAARKRAANASAHP
jgi:hypothetical protein